MFSLFKKSTTGFIPNKKMMEAAIIKGEKIGLPRENLVEMISLMDKNLTKHKVEKMIDKTLGYHPS